MIGAYNGFRYADLDPGHHAGLPSGNLTFIISLADPIDIVAMPGRQDPARSEAFVGGLHLRPAWMAHDGHGAGIGIEVSPLASRAIFGMPAAELSSQIIDLTDLLGAEARRLLGMLAETTSWPERFALVDGVLASLRRDASSPAPEMVMAWTALSEAGGNLPIARLAEKVGYSRRHLSKCFSAEFGMSPKEAARILRFERTCGLLDVGLSLSEAAVTGGYYDQAHLTNEWRELAGQSPVSWQADELRDRSSPHDGGEVKVG